MIEDQVFHFQVIDLVRMHYIFGVDMSSSKKKDILVLGKGSTQGLEHTLTAEKLNAIIFTVTNKIFFF